jgi:hypothetical protein
MRRDKEITAVLIQHSGLRSDRGVRQWVLYGRTRIGSYCYSKRYGWNADGAWTGFDREADALAEAAAIVARLGGAVPVEAIA